ncbi:right-handed parallel beta-helix repeat-containing protein [Nostoc sphaeroides CHAB 2801]|uniref:right-handed parallel beta-helix repeat-containing protein n=1 Tax=Nostoc sphaeroides TaxID=446679 RepID=UPI001E549F0B|nr:right-handed parallel beta-helix repeat-containing protein [Nostoc sphaeroides]MCC5631644.1 right-handed parallel beta-helix repeat-containing protein [Nostoc sphaeroides CHAB 2801]
MMIHGLGFLSLSASLVLPWALTGLVQGQRITESLIKDVRQSSTDQEIPLPSRKLISQVPTGTKYYVSGKGNDRNSGLTTSSAFRTIQRAADLTKPGDTVLIMNGVYNNAHPSGSVLNIKRSGRANAWITYKAYPEHRPKLQHNGWHGIWIIEGASYIEVNGLEVVGNNGNISRAYGLSQKYNQLNPLTNGNCISINGEQNSYSRHIRILNNKVHDCGGGGIGATAADYITIDNNEVFNNAWYSVHGCSGISLLNNWNSDNNQNYKMFITRNKVYNNRMLVPWLQTGKIQDGNGIIIDRGMNKQKGSKLSPYRGRTLIANNISYKNGGGGIHTFQSENIDIVYNTTYLNNQSPEISGGQISINASNNINVLNNILYSERGKAINSSRGQNIRFDYNLNANSQLIKTSGSNDMIANPQFMNVSAGDFRLKSTSPAINSGMKFNSVTTDFLGGYLA